MRRLAVVLLFLGLVPGSAGAIEVIIRQPPPDLPALGRVEVDAEVISGAPVTEVVIRVDGRVAGRLEEPPFRISVDLGEDNLEHLFEVTARNTLGEERIERRRTPRIQVDEELHLDLRQLYVTATREGRRVLDFERPDFEVLDGGERQQIVTFERGDIPLTAAILVDTSLSMKGRRLREAIAGARSFVTGMRELDEAMLLLFSDLLLHATPFTHDLGELSGGLDDLTARGGTAINDHLYLALKLLDVRQGRRVVILLSDGGDIESNLGVEDVLRKAGRSPAMVYWIRPRYSDSDLFLSWSSAWRSAEQTRREFRGLERLVTESGGRIVDIVSLEEAPTAFQEILAELRDQYVIGYYPSVRRRDGSWRPVRVRLEGSRGQLRTRKGYIDD